MLEISLTRLSIHLLLLIIPYISISVDTQSIINVIKVL